MPLPTTCSRWARAARTSAAAVLGLLALAAPASAFDLGFNSENLVTYAGRFNNPVNLPALQAGLDEGAQAGARTWRVVFPWNAVAGNATAAPQPATLAADPNWPGYNWAIWDRMVRGITAAGMQPLLWTDKAPTWAQGPGNPGDSKYNPAGTWKPQAAPLEQFAKALATRYSGTFPDPENPGKALPKVSLFQGWNEPNLWSEINPQWEKKGGKQTIASARILRSLQNAFYKGVKSVRPDATVLLAGTAPFGGLTAGDPRIPPARFYRELFCVKSSHGTLKANKKCPKVRFDGWAHHTYPIGPPTRTARNKDDVVVPDMPKLTRIMAAAKKAKLVPAKAAGNVWITEMSWESKPDPSGLSLEDHALYMQAAFYVLWKSGVKHVIWWNSRDDAPGKDWNATYQSGIFLRGTTPAQDTRKPAWTAFHFPFTAYRAKGVAALWTMYPGAGPITVEAQSATGTWGPVATLKPNGDGTASGRIRVGPGTNLRATQAGQTSLTWKTF